MNPYEAPKTVVAEGDPFEQLYAKRVLAARERGMTAALFYGHMARGYLFLFTFIGLGIAYFVWLELDPGIYFLAGMAVATLLRDFGIFRAQRKGWRPACKVMDWGKVERMAAGEAVE
jgi:hypothetical protein